MNGLVTVNVQENLCSKKDEALGRKAVAWKADLVSARKTIIVINVGDIT